MVYVQANTRLMDTSARLTTKGRGRKACKGENELKISFYLSVYPLSKSVQPVSQSQKCGSKEKYCRGSEIWHRWELMHILLH